MNSESQNYLLCWWLHLSKAQVGILAGKDRSEPRQGGGEQMREQVGGMLRGQIIWAVG